MSAQFDSLIEQGDQKSKRRKLIITIILVVIGLHIAGGVLAGLFVVARYFMSPPAQFEVVRDIRLPAQQRQHKMNMAEFDALTPKPSFNDKMASLRPTDFALPDLPDVPMDQMLPLDPSEIVADAVSSLVGAAGVGGGGAGLGGLGGTGEGFSFMGVQANGRRIVLLFDVSSSVKNKADRSGMPLSRIRDETVKLIESLGINARFGIIQFTQNFQPFRTEMIPATAANKEEAQKWLESEWVETGSMSARKAGVVANPDGVLGVLRQAFLLEPDVIFLLSDGSFQRNLGDRKIETIPIPEIRQAIDALQKNLPTKAQIHFIGFEMKPEDKKELQRVIAANGGKLREMGKD